MISHRSLRDSTSPKVYSTLLSILANFNNAVVWMFSTCPLISMSSNPFINPLGIVPSAPITIGITITFMFFCFFSSLVRSRYLSFFRLLLFYSLRVFNTNSDSVSLEFERLQVSSDIQNLSWYTCRFLSCSSQHSSILQFNGLILLFSSFLTRFFVPASNW